MKRQLQNLFSHAYTSMGLYRLAAGFGSFALVHLGFNLFTNLQGVFINTLLIRMTGDNDIVMLYNIILWCFSGPMMLVASQVARRTSPTFVMRVGIIFHIMVYVLFLLTMDNLTRTMPLIAICSGTGNGFSWFSYSFVINVFSTDESRDLAVSLMGIIGGCVSLTMPAISGMVISCFDGLTGYLVMFAFSLGMALVTVALSRRMKRTQLDAAESQLGRLMRVIFSDKLYLLCLSGDFLKCLREGICSFLFNILLFSAITNEAVVGLNTLLAGLASIIGAWAYGKLVSSRTRIRSMGIATSVLLGLCLMLFFGLSPVTIILYSTINAALGTFLMNPTFSLSYALVLGDSKCRSAMPEFIGLRECMISFGRICGVVFTLFMPHTSVMGYIIIIVFLTAMQYLTTFVMFIVKRGVDRRAMVKAS